MPNSPKTTFEFENNNNPISSPLLGVSHVIARTTKGPFLDPSKIISSYTQFKSLYGSEIVPDGSVSNIEVALSLGSKLRISRVKGTGATQGTVKLASINAGKYEVAIADKTGLTLKLSGGGLATPVTFLLGIKTREMGSPMGGADSKFMHVLSKVGNTVVSSIYNTIETAKINSNYLIDQMGFIKFLDGSALQGSFIDTSLLNTFIKENKYLDVTLTSSSATNILSLDGMLEFLDEHQGSIDGVLDILGPDAATELTTGAAIYCIGTEGSAGATPTAVEWVAALEPLKDYQDAYQLGCSHIHQHISSSTEVETVNSAMKAFAELSQDIIYYIDVPKYGDTGLPKTKAEIITYIQNMITKIGYSKHVAYFAGGLKYYNSKNTLKNCDNLGTALGLGDASASSYGPWYSFAGQNRGLVNNAKGPVSENFGVSSKYLELNELAGSYANVFVIKDTALMGKRTMLWHNFTSQLKDNSEKFLGITRLGIYLKKNLKPLVEKYFEEPNDFTTWNNMFLDIKPVLEDLKTRRAMSEYTWNGDQYAAGWDDCQVNNETDARAGKYKAKLTYKDIVTLQDVTIVIAIDTVAGTVQVNNEQ